MTTPCYYCEEDRATACRVCIHGYDGPTPGEVTAWKRDVARYRWLRDHAKEELVRPETLNSELPDMRTHWVLPMLIAYGPFGGPTRTLDEAIDDALRAAAAARTKC